MTWLARLLDVAPARIGPGRLVLVVGPSGAGKDTLIRAAREACRGDQRMVFCRRVVTRAASGAEEHDTLAAEDFALARSQGAFALWWSAHGLDYGIPVAIDDALRADRTVICNVSRAIVGIARERYARVSVVLVTAPHDVLRARLAERGRSSDGDLDVRLARSAALASTLAPDLIIENSGPVARGAGRLVDAVRDQPVPVWL